jgi:hypothetical protein
MPSMTRRIAVQLLLCGVVYLSNVALCSARQSAGAPSGGTAAKAALTVDQVVSRMEQRNQERAAALRTYEGTRLYRMQYRGFFGSHDAEIVVAVKASPSEKEFTVESQSGSKFIIDHVLRKLLDGEKEATDDQARSRTALTSRNYAFTLAGLDDSADDPQYILNVVPKTDEKYLYRGRIWVDSNDFAVTRIEAEPARSPSMWIKKAEIRHKYEKVGDFWLPEENRTESLIRLGGRALLSIDYRDYKITGATSLSVSSSPVVAIAGH